MAIGVPHKEKLHSKNPFDSSRPVSPHTAVRVQHKWNQWHYISLLRQTKSIAFCVYISLYFQIDNPINIDQSSIHAKVQWLCPLPDIYDYKWFCIDRSERRLSGRRFLSCYSGHRPNIPE